MAKSADILIREIRANVRRLLYDEVIQHTIVVMRNLSQSLTQLASSVGSDAGSLTEEQKAELRDVLIPLTSESIREALHKGELPITNGIIRSKNRILKALGVAIPDGHAEIDPADFPNYNW
jgi:hypothetical protein